MHDELRNMLGLWSAGQIAKRIPGVTTRQILDLAEKGFISPARDTTGAGSPRLYDFNDIFEICICLAIRGKIPAGGATQELIKEILMMLKEIANNKGEDDRESDSPGRHNWKMLAKSTSQETYYTKPPFDLLLVSYDDDGRYEFGISPYNLPLERQLKKFKKYKPQNYCTYVIEVAALWKYLKDIF